MKIKKILVFFVLLGVLITFTFADIEFNFIYGISKPNLGDFEYLYSAQNDELTNLQNQGYNATSGYTFTLPDIFKDYGGEIKFSISQSLWLGIEYTKTKLNHVLTGSWTYEKTEDNISENISATIDNFSTDYDINNFGLNLYWKFQISSHIEIEAGIGASYIKVKDDNKYSAIINNRMSFGSEYAHNEIKITQTSNIETSTYGGKAGLRLNFKITKTAGIFIGSYYSYFSPKELTGAFRYTATSKYTSSLDNSEYTNNSTYTGNGEFHIIIRKGDGADMKYIRPTVKPLPPGEESDQGVAKSNFSGVKAVLGVFFRF